VGKTSISTTGQVPSIEAGNAEEVGHMVSAITTDPEILERPEKRPLSSELVAATSLDSSLMEASSYSQYVEATDTMGASLRFLWLTFSRKS